MREIESLKGLSAASSYVERCYTKAEGRLKERPTFQNADDVLREIARIRVEPRQRNGRLSGSTDQSVLLAHMQMAARRKSLT